MLRRRRAQQIAQRLTKGAHAHLLVERGALRRQKLARRPLEPGGVGDVENVLQADVAGQVAHQVEERDRLAAAGQALDRGYRDVAAQQAVAHGALFVKARVQAEQADFLKLIQAAQVDGVIGLVVMADRVDEDRVSWLVTGHALAPLPANVLSLSGIHHR